MAYPFKTFTPATNRTGIPEAIESIVTRHEDGELATSIVLPPRYGKSDVIRLAAIELTETGAACTALVLAPYEQIVEQLVDSEKIRDMVKRYMTPRLPGTPVGIGVGSIKQISSTFHETSNMHHLFSATIQLVDAQRGAFTKWLDRCMQLGSRPIVFIDEGQYTSTKNKWGEIATLVMDAGGHVVLLTGTKWRSDKEAIPGFEVTRNLDEGYTDKAVNSSTRVDDKHVLKRKWLESKGVVALKAHTEVSFREAWDQNAMAHVEIQYVDADLKGLYQGAVIDTVISEAKQTTLLSALRKAVTDEDVIHKAMAMAVRDMQTRREAGQADSACLVVTVSDLEDQGDGQANWHARRIRDAVKGIDTNLSFDIATQAVTDGSNSKGSDLAKRKIAKFIGYTRTDSKTNLTSFVAGVGDILAVKSMGTVGLDCPRLKTLVFLGTNRQLSQWIQAVLRVGTVWGDVEYGTVITLEDILSRQNWEYLVKCEGGDMDFTSRELVEENLEAKDKEDDKETALNVENSRETHIDDSRAEKKAQEAPAENGAGDVYTLFGAIPYLRNRFSVVEADELLKAGTLVLPTPTAEEPIEVAINVSSVDIPALADRLENLTRGYAKKKAGGGHWVAGWQEAKKGISNAARRHAGLRTEPKKETDSTRLDSAIAFVEQRLKELDHG